MARRYLALVLCLAACDDSNDKPRRPTTPVAAWEIGPNGHSEGLQLAQYADGWGFEFGPNAGPHYVTTRHGSLEGKTAIRMSYRAEANPETIIHGKGCSSPSAVTLYLQRAGDDWSKDGWRWWATFASAPLSKAGEGSIVAPLDGKWTSVSTKTADNAPTDFLMAKKYAERVGFTFANCEGYGHGARATGPVRFVVTNFVVE